MSDQANAALDAIVRMAQVLLPPKTGMVIILAEADDSLPDGANATVYARSNLSADATVEIIDGYLRRKKAELAARAAGGPL